MEIKESISPEFVPANYRGSISSGWQAVPANRGAQCEASLMALDTLTTIAGAACP